MNDLITKYRDIRPPPSLQHKLASDFAAHERVQGWWGTAVAGGLTAMLIAFVVWQQQPEQQPATALSFSNIQAPTTSTIRTPRDKSLRYLSTSNLVTPEPPRLAETPEGA